MGIIKDPYEISVWGDETASRKNAVKSGGSEPYVYTLTYNNEMEDVVTEPIEIIVKEQLDSSSFILPNRNFTISTVSASTTTYSVDLSGIGNNFLLGRGIYNTSTRILTKTHEFLKIKKSDMKESTSLIAPSGYKWYSYSGIKNLVDLNKRNKSECRFNLGEYSTKSGNVQEVAVTHFYISKAGYLQTCLPENFSNNTYCEYIFPVLNTETRYIALNNDIELAPGVTTITVTADAFNYNLYIPSRIKEYKICTIGTDSLTSDFRAIEPKFVENINGTHSLSFYMYYNINGEDNPYTKYLFNERKIKVNWKNNWYDLVIKNLVKDSANRTVSYTCKDSYENELSKNGYDLIFDNELQNNSGTPEELAQRVLEGTDWTVGYDKTIKQKTEEPVYECTLTNAISSATNIDEDPQETETISSNSNILVYYNPIINLTTNGVLTGTIDLEFMYVQNGEEYKTDLNSQLVINGTHYLKKGLTYQIDTSVDDPVITFKNGNTTLFSINYLTGVSGAYRAERLVNKNQIVYDPLVDKYVEVYVAKQKPTSGVFKDSFLKNDIIHHYTATEFETPDVVNNLIVNNNGFLNSSGWVSGGADNAVFSTKLYPQYYGQDNYDPKGYLIIPKVVKSSYVRNRGLSQYLSFLPDGIQKGEYFYFRIKAYSAAKSGNAPSSTLKTGFRDSFNIIRYTDNTTYLEKISSEETRNGWVQFTCKATKSISYNELKTGNYIFQFSAKTDKDLWIEDVQFYPVKYGLKPVYDDSGNIVTNNGEIVTEEVIMEPGDMDFLTLSKQVHYFYNYSQTSDSTTLKDLTYLFKDVDTNEDYGTLMSLLTPSMTDYQKISSIQVSKSNRFNILQEIAETFKCWCVFKVEHNISGQILSKRVIFEEEVGQETYIGFEYGTDLRSVTRTIQSDQFTTKIIVPQNSNEYAKNGFCTISRSELNYPKTNYILNFDYYINHAMISATDFVKDLYDTTNGIGYYTQLNSLNTSYDEIGAKLVEAQSSLNQHQATYETASKAVISTTEKITDVKNELISFANGITWEDFTTQNCLKKNKDETYISSRVGTIGNLEVTKKENETIANSSKKNIASLEKEIAGYKAKLTDISTALNTLDAKFETKYRSFIREGTWQDESYVDDNLYYLDAQEVAYTSSRPQVSYNVSVLRLSALDDFKAKVFNIGDIAYVQDIDFFGYQKDGITPYKEKVVVTEITSYFDEPDKDTITVQNYRTQFEDLFQRITASVQALQYNSGSYARAAGAITSDGALTDETVKKTFGDKIIVYSTQNENIKQDETGITVSDLISPNLKTWLSPTGLQITEDGGLTWKSTISGKGIETDNLTSGMIYTESIAIMDGNHTSFRWNEEGITAYAPVEDVDNPEGFNQNKFTRFDHYGIYGIDKSQGYKIAISRKFNGEEYYEENIVNDEFKGYNRSNTEQPVNDVEYYLLAEEPVVYINDVSNEAEAGVTYYNKDHQAVTVSTEFEPDEIYYIKIDDEYQLVDYIVRLKTNNNYEPVLDADGNNIYTVFTGHINYGYTYYSRSPFSIIENQFNDTEIYYEYNNTGDFVVTEDEEPVFGKNYYFFTPIDAGFPNYLMYYKSGNNYVLVENGHLFDPEKIYCTLQITTTMLSSFDELSRPYYVYANDPPLPGEQPTPTGDSRPLAGVTYWLPKNFTPSNEEEIWEVGSYGLTWNGFFLKSRGRENETTNGSISISSDKDIRVTSQTGQGSSIDRIIIGRLYQNEEDTAPSYGIRINDSNGSPVLITDSTGDLWLRNILYIGEGSNHTIRIGYYEVYVPTSDTAPIPAKEYYIINENGEYELVTFEEGESFVQDVNYYEKDLNQVFNANEKFIIKEDGSIYAKDGEFTGNIYATAGSFNGTITAANGAIGGFIIGTDTLSSATYEVTEDEEPIPSKDYYVYDENTGKYKEQELGEDYIETEDSEPNLGKIYYIEVDQEYVVATFDEQDPQFATGVTYYELKRVFEDGVTYFDRIGNLVLNSSKETIKVGQITVDGANSTIQGTNFYLSPQISKFNSVEISGVLRSTVFEANHVQAVGGSMIFKPSYNISEEPTQNGQEWNIKLDVESEDLDKDGYIQYAKVNEFVLVSLQKRDIEDNISYQDFTYGNIIGKITALSSQNYHITIDVGSYGSISMPYASSIVFLGPNESRAIGINSNTGGIAGLLEGEGLTISTFTATEVTKEDSELGSMSLYQFGTFESNLFLGNLSKITNTQFGQLDGFGLYADTVYLRGALTTLVRENSSSFAGVNTNSQIVANTSDGIGHEYWPDSGNDPGYIIFWGGAASLNETDIKNSPFIVTDKGNLYVKSGYFTGTIITESTIQAAEIRTAKIYGTGKEEGDSSIPGLILYDMTNAISFQKTSGDIVFEIGIEGFYTVPQTNDEQVFIGINDQQINTPNNDVNFYGNNLAINTARFYSDGTQKITINDYIAFGDNEEEVGVIKLNSGQFNFTYNKTSLIVDENSIELSKQETEISNIYFGRSNGTGTLKFNHVDNGFDIYVL